MRPSRRNCAAASTRCYKKAASSLRMKFEPWAPPQRRSLKIPKLSWNSRAAIRICCWNDNAELLLALEHISLRWLWLDPQFYGRIRFDAAGYRGIRIEELKLSARVAADRVRETHAPFRFNAMSSRERRILHLVLKEEAGVRSESEGAGEERQVVVYPVELNQSKKFRRVWLLRLLKTVGDDAPLRVENNFKRESRSPGARCRRPFLTVGDPPPQRDLLRGKIARRKFRAPSHFLPVARRARPEIARTKDRPAHRATSLPLRPVRERLRVRCKTACFSTAPPGS